MSIIKCIFNLEIHSTLAALAELSHLKAVFMPSMQASFLLLAMTTRSIKLTTRDKMIMTSKKMKMAAWFSEVWVRGAPWNTDPDREQTSSAENHFRLRAPRVPSCCSSRMALDMASRT